MTTPRLAANKRNDGPDAAGEYAIGSVPVGSWIELWSVDDQMIYRGYVSRQSPWGGYAVVVPITEGDGNYAGSVEGKTLYRLYAMSDQHYVQESAPCRWLGVDEELRATLVQGTDVTDSENEQGGAIAQSSTLQDNLVSLVPMMSLIPIDCEEADDGDR